MLVQVTSRFTPAARTTAIRTASPTTKEMAVRTFSSRRTQLLDSPAGGVVAAVTPALPNGGRLPVRALAADEM